MIFRRFPNFGKELRRPFEVHAICYDCADFYDDCRGYPADRDKGQNRPQCEKYQRLADVMPPCRTAGGPGPGRTETAAATDATHGRTTPL